ncbi:MAG TPA: hypothetical protein VI932_11735 [Bacteroidota bacterium]|nr:hypothetical protein [Bacteroidota bacterium]
MTSRIILPIHFIPLLLAAGCGPSDDGFRFHGDYEAARSGYRIQMLSEGYVEQGHDIARSAFAIVQFCPTRNSNAIFLRMTLTAAPDQSIRMACRDLGLQGVEWNWKTSEGLLRGLLSSAGYRTLDPAELLGSVKVIESSLSGPKGVVLRGQIESLRVLRADIEFGYDVAKDKPPGEWIEPSEVMGCVQ